MIRYNWTKRDKLSYQVSIRWVWRDQRGNQNP